MKREIKENYENIIFKNDVSNLILFQNIMKVIIAVFVIEHSVVLVCFFLSEMI